MDNIYIVYKVTNKLNNKIYIGLTKHSIEIRKKFHMYKKGESRSVFQNALHKYGLENFIWEEFVNTKSLENAQNIEIELIKYYNSTNRKIGYNRTIGGEGGPIIGYWTGKKRDKKTIDALNKGKNLAIEKLGHGFRFGILHTEEAKKKMGKQNIGKSPPNKGIPMTKEQKKLSSQRCKTKHPIVLVDLSTGMTLNFDSIKEAANELGIDRGAIYKKLKLGHRYKNYRLFNG